MARNHHVRQGAKAPGGLLVAAAFLAAVPSRVRFAVLVGVELTDKSDLEQAFLFYVNALGLPKPDREWRFHPKRRWRFDFAWPSRLVAVECEGGTWSRGRHVRGQGFENDCWKYSTAAVLGWKVLRVTGGMLERATLDFLDLLVQALNGEDEKCGA